MRPGLLRLISRLDPSIPVIVHDGRLDLVATNSSATELFGSVAGEGLYGRNIAHRAFTSSALADRLDRDGQRQLLRVAAAELRAALSRYPDDLYLLGLFHDLTATSPTFCECWERGEVGAWRSALKRLHHPSAGWLDFDVEVLHDPERDHRFMLYILTSEASDQHSPGRDD